MLNIGSKCYVNGAICEIVGQDGSDRWTVVGREVHATDKPLVVDMGGNKVHMQISLFEVGSCAVASIPKSECQPIITELFNIKDEVRACYKGNMGFTGRIVAFELASNRAICMSDKVGQYNNARQRFAYAWNEIEKLPTTFEFKLNHKYQVPAGQVFRTVASPQHPNGEYLLLIDDASGQFVSYTPLTAEKDWLKDLGLDGLRDMSVKNYRG